MALYTRYSGEFLSRKGVAWRVDILQESGFPFDEIGELTFDADNALQFEYSGDKTDTIIGCTATLKIQSPTDRAYIDLYTIAVGQIRMDVYKEGELYWRGCLDPEFYEEPYEMLDHYTVTLTFSDFGILDRLSFTREGTGLSDLRDLLLECLDRASLDYIEYNEISNTHFTNSTSSEPLLISQLSVRNANFYDEEGEAMTMYEVLEGVLKPLGQRIMQHNGQIYVYDFDALYERAERAAIVWSSDKQTLGVDSTYNNVTVTFSAYAQNIEIPEEVWTEEIDETLCPYTLNGYDTYGNCQVFGYDYLDGAVTSWDSESEEEYNGPGFSLWTSFNGENVEVHHTNVYASGLEAAGRYFKIVPFYKGEDCEGVVLKWDSVARDVHDNDTSTWTYYSYGITDAMLSGAIDFVNQGSYLPRYSLFSSEQVEIPNIADPENYALCISIEMMLSGTTTPYHDTEPTITYEADSVGGKAGTQTFEAPSDLLNGMIQYILVPVTILFVTDDGEYYEWQNMSGVDSDGFPATGAISTYSWKESLGEWVLRSNPTPTRSFIAYYNTSDPKSNSPSCVGGWGTNSHYTGLTPSVMPQATKIEGQCIAYPNLGKSGKVMIGVYSDWLFYTYTAVRYGVIYRHYNWEYWDINRGYKDGATTTDYAYAQYIRWAMCKTPQISIVNATAYDTELNTDDVEYKGIINPDAKDDLEIDTICGTAGGIRPTARGGYYRSSNGQQLSEFWRAEDGGPIEKLLINTMYSQFAERHTTLEGEAELDTGFHIYTEQNQDDKVFIATEITENVIQDVADMQIVELSPDEYAPTE